MRHEGGAVKGASVADEEVSWIARERLEPGAPDNRWIMAVILVAGAVFMVLAVVGLSPLEPTAAEQTYRSQDGPVQALDASLTPSIARILRAGAAGAAVLATAFAARRLLHSEAVSVLVASLLVMDTGFLVHGRLATPVAASAAAALVALALFLSPQRHAHWVAAGSLAVACFLEPAYLAWGVVLAMMVLTRGHIYAAPQHAYMAGLQTILLPAVGAVVGIVAGASLGPKCFLPPRGQGLLMAAPVDLGSGIHYHPNPVLWVGGIAALLWLGGMAAYGVLRDFRMQRLPGRIQVRLTQPLRREQGRMLWVLALAVAAPTTALWAPVFALAIGAAVQELGRDAGRFGLVISLGVLVLALAYTVRLWPLLIGAAPEARIEELVDTVPWARVISC